MRPMPATQEEEAQRPVHVVDCGDGRLMLSVLTPKPEYVVLTTEEARALLLTLSVTLGAAA